MRGGQAAARGLPGAAIAASTAAASGWAAPSATNGSAAGERPGSARRWRGQDSGATAGWDGSDGSYLSRPGAGCRGGIWQRRGHRGHEGSAGADGAATRGRVGQDGGGARVATGCRCGRRGCLGGKEGPQAVGATGGRSARPRRGGQPGCWASSSPPSLLSHSECLLHGLPPPSTRGGVLLRRSLTFRRTLDHARGPHEREATAISASSLHHARGQR